MITIENDGRLDALRAGGAVNQHLLDLVGRRMREVIAAFAETGWTWDADEHGAFAIVEEHDGPVEFAAIGLGADGGLLGACWEICHAHTGLERAWEVVVLLCGDTGWSVFVPMDVPWLDPELRAKLVDEATDPPPPAGANVDGVPF